MKADKLLKSSKFKLSVLLIALLVSLGFNLKTHLRSKYIPVIRGSYQTDHTTTEVESFTFMNEGTYIRYRGSEVIDKGNYIKEPNNIYRLKSDHTNQCIILNKDFFYFYDRDLEKPLEFFKVSTVPTLFGNKNTEN